MNKLPKRVEWNRREILEVAADYAVDEIWCSGRLHGMLFFVIKTGEEYDARRHVSLTRELSFIADEPVVVMRLEKLEGVLREQLLRGAVDI